MGPFVKAKVPKLARLTLPLKTLFRQLRWHLAQPKSCLRSYSAGSKYPSSLLASSPKVDNLDPIMTETTYDDKTYNIVREGLAEILSLKQQLKDDGRADGSHQERKVQDVFYNPIQQFNRDLTVLAIRAFGDDLAVRRQANQKKRKLDGAKNESRAQKRKREIEKEEGPEADRVLHNNGTIVEPLPGNGIKTTVQIAEEGAEGPPKDAEPSGQPNTGDRKRKKELEDSEVVEAGEVFTEFSRTFETVSDHKKSAVSKVAKDEVGSHSTGDGSTEMPIHSETGEPSRLDQSTSWSKSQFRILDALSATGLRAIRYAKEIPETTMVIANDISPQATASIRLNISHNEVSDKVNVLTGDARAHMYHVAAPTQSAPKKGEGRLYEVIDLDPYGTAVPLLDAAVRALVDGGLLCVTCTDAAVFASAGYLEKTFAQYGGIPWKGGQCHEAGLRLVLQAMAVCAARYGISVEPLLSLSIDFYVRVFVRIHRSPAQVKFLAGKSMIVYHCDMGCGAWETQFLAQTRTQTAKNGNVVHKFGLAQAPSTSPFCEHCGFKTHLVGPMWGGPLHNPFFIRRILDALPSLDRETYGTIPRIEGMLSLAYEESVFGAPPKNFLESEQMESPVPQADHTLRDVFPFFLHLSTVGGVLHCESPADAVFCSALERLGYRTSRSHTKPGSIRTDAPWSVVWEVMREWVRQKSPVKEGAIRKGTPGWAIMQKDRSNVVLNSVKTRLKQAAEKSEDLQSLRTELESILYRIREENPNLSSHPTTITDPNIIESAATSSEHQTNNPHQAEFQPPPPSTINPPSSPNSSRLITPAPIPTHQLEVNFDEISHRSRSSGRKIVRYQMNPRPDWGPMSRARGG